MVKKDGIWYKKAHGHWHYYGEKKEGFGKNWENYEGYWWYKNIPFTYYGNSFFFYENGDWQWIGHNLPIGREHTLDSIESGVTKDNLPPHLTFGGKIISMGEDDGDILDMSPTSKSME